MQLTTEQMKQLDNNGSVPVVVEGRSCVLVRSDVFAAREQALLDEWHPETMQRQMAAMLSDDWNEPEMSVYDDE